MLADIILPNTSELHLVDCQLEDQTLYVSVCATQSHSPCPDCGMVSGRVHSTYLRTLTDLPCSAWQVRLLWVVRRFFCDNPQCQRKTFAEQLPVVAARYARRTQRLTERQRQTAFECGGESGQRLCTIWGLSVSSDLLLRLIRYTPCSTQDTLRVLGIDDWAFRKRHTYGTILVDLERQRVIDLLPDREASTVAAWLRQHPSIEIVSRDRGQTYIEGVTAGAPQATQVADRFHLLRNLLEVLTKVCERRVLDLKTLAKDLELPAIDVPVTAEPAAAATISDVNLSPREVVFQKVKQLQQQGQSQRVVARETGLSRQTVARYFRLAALPPRTVTYQTRSAATAFLPYLLQRWEAGCQNRRQLFEEIQTQGYRGSYASVWRALRYLQQPDATTKPSKVRSPYSAPRNAAWLLMCPGAKLTVDEERARAKLCAHSEPLQQAYTLAQAFWKLFQKSEAPPLDAWLNQAATSAIPEFERFAKSLRSDYQAVQAALTLPWSNGQVEGQVNRLKLIKRQMYGRAKFDLLRQRVIGLT